MAGSHSFSQQAGKAIKSNSFRTMHWTKDQGLSWNGMNSMIKDAKGFLWVGSQYGGFCRFDGARFEQYLPSPDNRLTINSDKIHSFIEDSLNNIWITTSKGLSRYDIQADTFTNFSFVDSISPAFNIVPFASTRENILCIESQGLITAIDIHTFKRKILVPLSRDDDPGIHLNSNHSYFDAGTKSIWLLPVHKQGRLQQIFLDGRTAYYQWPCYRKNVKHRHSAEDMRYDRNRNSVWINSGDGLLEFSLIDKQFRPIEALKSLTKSEKYDRGVGVEIDFAGRIWFSTFFDGIFIYDPQANIIQPVFSVPEEQLQVGDANLHIYFDKHGIAWTSNWLSHGIYEILPYHPPVTRFVANPQKKGSLSDQGIHSIIPASNSEVWIGTEKGLNIFDNKTGKFQALTQKELPGVSGEVNIPLHIDTVRQKAWIGSSSPDNTADLDLYEMDIKTRKCKRIIIRDGTKILDTVSILADFFWPYKKGLLFADEKHGIFEIAEQSQFAELIIPFRNPIGIGRMVLVEDRFIFLQRSIETPNFSFENKSGKWVQVNHPLDTLEWMSLFYNKDNQTYWVGFKYELVQYDNGFRPLKRYRQGDGYHGMAHEMLMDNDGNLWFSNNLNQINRLDTALGVITNITENEGYQKQNRVWITPLAKDGKGNLYFGGINYGSPSKNGGLDRIIPGRYSSGATSSIYLRSLDINHNPFQPGTGINNLEDLSLRYNQNTISFETGIIDYYANGKGHIRYKLKSDDIVEDWQYGPAYYTIRYEKLPPGRYELVLQASNAGNEFNSPEKIVRIFISPPFWQTWWFRLLATIVTVAIIYAIVQYRSRSLKLRNKQLEEKVILRTTELKQSLEDLKATQSQLIQSEKMASLGELTAGIAHEIQNPLNFVNNFSELNSELLVEMKDELDKGNLDEVKLLAGDVIGNQEKINHHGKRAEAIVKGMLQHSRASTGKKEPSDINALMDEYLRLAYHGMKAKDKSFEATLKTNYDESIGSIRIIPQDIGKVLLNLINNAFYAVTERKKTAGPAYEPVVSVYTKKLNGNIEISVKDNGTGIPPKIVDKVFQPFFTTKPTGQGTGLGLSLSYDIVKAHGGELTVETVEGEGAEFIIRLPV